MALPPKFKAFRLTFTGADSVVPAAAGPAEPLHTVELFLDYVCPFSAKLFNTVHTRVAPRIRSNKALAGKVQFIFRPQVQPWHPSSTLVHEAGIAVARLVAAKAPLRFWDFSAALFADQSAYFDVGVVNELRNDTYRRLARLAASSAGVAEDDVFRLLEVSDKPAADGGLNIGNKVTNDLKVVVKMARLVGVHVSPTVIFDGVVANEISSSWTEDQWMEWLNKNVA